MEWAIPILALSILIIIHEGGHYYCARASGMHVHRFSIIGIGPPILKLFTYKETEFVISAIPFGAYVHIAGMEAEDDQIEDDDGDGDEQTDGGEKKPKVLTLKNGEPMGLYRDKPLGARILAVFGGPLANYLTAMILAVGLIATTGLKGTPTSYSVHAFNEASPAKAAGLEAGDTFLSIAGESVVGEDAAKFQEISAKHVGKIVPVEVQRDGEKLSLPVYLNEQVPVFNVSLKSSHDYTPVGFGDAVIGGVMWPIKTTAAQLTGLWKLITGEKSGKVGGPVAIVKAIKQAYETGMVETLWIVVLISTLLGMFNLLPLPALDGGRLVFLAYELVLRREANRKLEETAHLIGMLALLGLIGYATVGDVKPPSTPFWQQDYVEYRATVAKELYKDIDKAETGS